MAMGFFTSSVLVKNDQSHCNRDLIVCYLEQIGRLFIGRLFIGRLFIGRLFSWTYTS